MVSSQNALPPSSAEAKPSALQVEIRAQTNNPYESKVLKNSVLTNNMKQFTIANETLLNNSSHEAVQGPSDMSEHNQI